MPARRKKVLATSEQPSIPQSGLQHQCSQLRQLGAIEQELTDQREADSRIENTLSKLVEDINGDRQKSAELLSKLEIELTRVGCALESSAQTNEQQVKNQTAMLKELGNLSKAMALMQQNQSVVHNQMQGHIEESHQWRTDIERRVSKLERIKWLIYIIGVGIASVLGVMAYIATIYAAFK